MTEKQADALAGLAASHTLALAGGALISLAVPLPTWRCMLATVGALWVWAACYAGGKHA